MSEINVNTIKKADGTGSLTVPAETGTVVTTASPSLGRRNLIINGDFQVSQRGAYTSATSISTWTYYVDRWKSTTSTVSGTIQYTDNVVKLTATSTGSNARLLTTQGIERINIRPSTDYTLSAWVKSNTSNARLLIYINGVWQVGQAHSGNSEWEQLIVNVTSQSATQPDEVWVRIGIMDGSGDPTITVTSGEYVEAYDVQLEVGSVATPFEHRSYGEELAACQRYFLNHNVGEMRIALVRTSDNLRRSSVFYPVTMRAQPTIVRVSEVGDGTTISTSTVTSSSVLFAASGADNVPYIITYTAEAEL